MPFQRVRPWARGLNRSTFVAASFLLAVADPIQMHAAAAQRDDDGGAKKASAGEQEVVIKREALKLTDPKVYRVSMHLQAVRTLALTAPVDGWVRTVSVKPQQKLTQQAEAVRLDDKRYELLLKRSSAGVQAAVLERKIAQGKNDVDLVALAEARLEGAQADLELAKMELERLVIRAPFNGEIERVAAIEGQFVRAGERLATLIDNSKLIVEVPVERAAAAPGGTIEIKVEEATVKAKVEAVIALGTQFDALRELTTSPASALVSIDNSAGTYTAGQTVYSDLIPLAPVTVAPSVAISNLPDGNRKLQVLRENVVRDLSVRILGKVGTESVFVSGRFNDGDEVIVSSTRPLADGTPLRALLAGATSGTNRGPAGRNEAGPAGGTVKKPGVGF